MMDPAKKREILEFIIELGVRLECRSIAINYAAVYFHKIYDTLPNEFCLYTVACTCISLGAKTVEDQRIRIRHIVSVSYRMLHPNEPPLPICELEAKLRDTLASMEQLVLRYLKFDLKVDTPHNLAYIMSATLKKQFPEQMVNANKFPTTLGTLLQDMSVYPEFMLKNDPICSAATIVSLALQLSNIDIKDQQWLSNVTKLISLSELQKLKRTFLHIVYNENL